MLIAEPLIFQRTGLHSILDLMGQGGRPIELKPGVYQIAHFGSTNFLSGYDDLPQFEERVCAPDEDADAAYRGAYGVCDRLDQLLAYYPELEASADRKFVVTMTSVKKADQPADGGWRWHKWGPYIGTKDPQYEYLHDEPNIDEVFVFQIYEKKV